VEEPGWFRSLALAARIGGVAVGAVMVVFGVWSWFNMHPVIGVPITVVGGFIAFEAYRRVKPR